MCILMKNGAIHLLINKGNKYEKVLTETYAFLYL